MKRSSRTEQQLQAALYRDAPATLRVPPNSIEAEQAVLGGIMLSESGLDEVADLLQPEHFYRHDHGLIFRSMQELAEKNQPTDAVTLGEWFERQGLADQVDGGAYLIELASTTPSAANIRAYAEIVKDKAVLRDCIDIGTELINSAFQPEGRDTEEILGESATRMANLAAGNTATDGGLRFVRNGLKAAYEDISARYYGTVTPAMPPPWPEVAEIWAGLEPGDLVILAGRPGMGKTVGALEFADHAAALGNNVAFFSLEMSSGQLTSRLISRRSGIPATRLRTKDGIEDNEWPRLQAAIAELAELPLAIDDYPILTARALAARAKRMHGKVPGGLGLVVIDYIQLLEGTSGKSDNRTADVTEISRALKLLAKQLKCPVVALSQLNRGLEARTNKRPVMSDLRESGALEQDADVIAFLYRESYYHPDTPAGDVTEFIIAKQRQGALGTAYLDADLACSRFLSRGSKARPSYTAPTTGDGGKKPRRRGYEGPREDLDEDKLP